MIAALSGVLFIKAPGTVVIDVQGVGYEVQVSGQTYDTLPGLGEEVLLHIHTAVREDAIALFGFSKTDEKQLFLLLNTVSGVGPKLALGILSGIGINALCTALRVKDLGRLTALSGVGKKTAQRLCIELGEKVGSIFPEDTGAGSQAQSPAVQEGFALQDAASALMNLGYTQEITWQALRAVQQKNPETVAAMKVEELIRHALQALA